MSMNDPVADMLARIRNAVLVSKEKVNLPYSVLKSEIVALLKDEGFVRSFKIVKGADVSKWKIEIDLKYHKGKPAIRGIKRISRPGLRVYSGSKEIPQVLNGLGRVILSTNRGVLSDKEAVEQNVGGEIICYVW